MYLTKRQREVLDYIESFIRERGYSPSLEEIGSGVGLSSLATIHKHLQNLQQKGFIRRSWNRGRSIEVTTAGIEPLTANMIELPILGLVAAGLPIAAIEDSVPETISVPQDFIRGRESYILRVQGDSMIDEQIRDGDFVIVEKRDTALNGETVVALVGGEEATVKKFYHEPGNRVRLQPANERLQPMYFDARAIAIQGIVVGLLRRYE